MKRQRQWWTVEQKNWSRPVDKGGECIYGNGISDVVSWIFMTRVKAHDAKEAISKAELSGMILPKRYREPRTIRAVCYRHCKTGRVAKQKGK